MKSRQRLSHRELLVASENSSKSRLAWRMPNGRRFVRSLNSDKTLQQKVDFVNNEEPKPEVLNPATRVHLIKPINENAWNFERLYRETPRTYKQQPPAGTSQSPPSLSSAKPSSSRLWPPGLEAINRRERDLLHTLKTLGRRESELRRHGLSAERLRRTRPIAKAAEARLIIEELQRVKARHRNSVYSGS